MFRTCGGVLVAPEGSAAAGMLYGGFFYYYNSLEDAVARRDVRFKVEYDANHQVIPHEYYGKP